MRFLHLSMPFLLSALIGCGGGASSGDDQGNQDNLDDKESPQLAHSARSLSPSSSCLTGGVTVQAGIDTNSNGILDPEEATDSFDICLNAPITESNPPLIVSNPADVESCPNGGLTILIGKDLNNDEQLADEEITTTSHVCNGLNGVDGADGIDGSDGADGTNGNDGNDAPAPVDRSNIFQVSTTYAYNNPDNPICVNGTYARTTLMTEYEIGDDLLENPLRECFSNQCGAHVENGTFSYYETGGEEGCFEHAQTNYSCDPGYQFNPISYACQRAPGGISNGNTCDLLDCSTEATCTEVGGVWNGTQCNSICPIGEIRTSRGCESPINSCDIEDSILDNQCVETNFTTIQPETMDLCGYVVEDYRLEAGEYLATCDVSFLGKTILEAGVSIKVDSKWDISFAAVTIKGTEANPVSIFGRSGLRMGALTINGIYNKITDPIVGNPSAGSIEYLSALNFTSINISNNKIAHSEFSTVDGEIKLNNVFTDTNSFETTADDLSSYYSRIELLNSLSMNDSFSAEYFYAKDSIVWNGFGPHLELQNTEKSETREHLLYTKAFPPMMIDSIFETGRCTNYDGEGPYEMSPTYHTDCDSRYSLHTSYVFINNSKELTVSPGQSFEVSLLSFDETGPVTDSETITWKAYYYRDGVQISVEDEWTGNPATISLDKIESYYVYPAGKTPINGRYTVNVY